MTSRSSRLHAGYVRRSSATTESPGNDSREAQEAAIHRIAGPDVTLYMDWGISGSGDGSKRPEYQRLKTDLAEGRIESVTAYSLSRLGRNAHELLGLVELCNAHDVTLRTAMENLDTKTAFGKGMIGMLAVFAQIELDQGAERSASARQARKARHEAAGLAMPPSLPPYGYVHVTEDGLTRVVRDESIRFEPIVEAYEEAGSIRQTAVRLNALGVPAPRGGLWGLNSIRRVLGRLADDGLIVMPEPNRRQRHPVATPALFAGLLVCHCGHRLTPNTKRHQYYCASARSNADHGRMSVTEAALLDVLRPEADLFVRTIRLEAREAGDELAKQRAVIERRQAALDARLEVDRITPEAYKAATRALYEEQAELHRNAAVTKSLRLDEGSPRWDDVQAMNVWLRRIWSRVQLDPDMVPTAVWRDAGLRFDAELVKRQEEEYRDPEAAGLIVLPVGLTQQDDALAG